MTDWIAHDGGPCPVPPETEVYVEGDGYLGKYPLAARYVYWSNIRSYRIVSPQPPASPVRMVPKIVIGLHGIVRVVTHSVIEQVRLSIVEDDYTAPELRDAARVLTELADAMEAGE